MAKDKCDKSSFCQWLSGVFTAPNEKGINQVIGVRDHGLEKLGVRFSRNKKDESPMFRFCPYCGEKVDFYSEPN